MSQANWRDGTYYYNNNKSLTVIGGVETAGPTAVFRVVVDEHVIGDGKQRTVHGRRRRYCYLHTPHHTTPHPAAHRYIEATRRISCAEKLRASVDLHV